MPPSCWKAHLLQRASCLKVCLISGNPPPDLPFVASIGAAVQVQQWGELWKFPDAFAMILSQVEEGHVALYLKQKNSACMTLPSCCHWSRKSDGFWRKEVIYLLCGKEKPHSWHPDTRGNVPPVFSKSSISPNTSFTLVMCSLPRQGTPPQLENRLVHQWSSEFSRLHSADSSE